MKKGSIHFIIAGLLLLLTVLPANAALSVLGLDEGASFELVSGTVIPIASPHQLIFDSGENVTWYDFTRGASSQNGARVFANTLEVAFNSATLVDWRLPTVAEFQSIFAGGASSVFDNLIASRYWLTDTGMIFDIVQGKAKDACAVNYNAIAVTSQVPIPGSLLLLGSGVVGLIGLRRKLAS